MCDDEIVNQNASIWPRKSDAVDSPLTVELEPVSVKRYRLKRVGGAIDGSRIINDRKSLITVDMDKVAKRTISTFKSITAALFSTAARSSVSL